MLKVVIAGVCVMELIHKQVYVAKASVVSSDSMGFIGSYFPILTTSSLLIEGG